MGPLVYSPSWSTDFQCFGQDPNFIWINHCTSFLNLGFFFKFTHLNQPNFDPVGCIEVDKSYPPDSFEWILGRWKIHPKRLTRLEGNTLTPTLHLINLQIPFSHGNNVILLDLIRVGPNKRCVMASVFVEGHLAPAPSPWARRPTRERLSNPTRWVFRCKPMALMWI